MSRRLPAVLLVLALVAVAGGAVALDRILPPPQPAADVTDAGAALPRGGDWACAVGDGRDGTALALSLIGPGVAGEEPGQVRLGTAGGGQLELAESRWVFPGTAVRSPGEVPEDGSLLARWWDRPVALYRTWRLQGSDDLPAGQVTGPCPGEASDRWLIPGMATAGGHEARLRLANVHETDATVAVRLVTPEGPVEPTVLQNLTVEGRSAVEVDVTEHLPERDDVAAEVNVVAGRVTVEGYQLVHQDIGDVNGVSLLSAAALPSTQWTVPWVLDDGGGRSWLWLHNPGDRPAPVQLTLHTPDGGVPPEGLVEVTVEPGQVRRIDLRGTLPEGADDVAITARSEGVPVVAAGASRIEADEVEQTGFAVQLGARPDDEWVLAGRTVPERNEQLRLANPEAAPALVDVAVWDGSTLRRPDRLRGIEVPPGGLRRIALADAVADAEAWAAFVTASEGQVVAGHLGQGGEDGRDLVAGPALPSFTWEPSGPALTGRHDRGMTQRTAPDPGDDEP